MEAHSSLTKSICSRHDKMNGGYDPQVGQLLNAVIYRLVWDKKKESEANCASKQKSWPYLLILIGFFLRWQKVVVDFLTLFLTVNQPYLLPNTMSPMRYCTEIQRNSSIDCAVLHMSE